MEIEVKNSTKIENYTETMTILEKRVLDVFTGKKRELLWLLEYDNIYTAGTSSLENEVIDKKIKIIRTNRGGKITYHGPGQKIVYFVLNLNKRSKDIKQLINKLENCIINVLQKYKLSSYRDSKNIGIWVGKKNDSKKIAAIGIKVKKWIAYHGFSLNINNDLTKYKKIIPCGNNNKKVTSLKKEGIININNIDNIIIRSFLDTFL